MIKKGLIFWDLENKINPDKIQVINNLETFKAFLDEINWTYKIKPANSKIYFNYEFITIFNRDGKKIHELPCINGLPVGFLFREVDLKYNVLVRCVIFGEGKAVIFHEIGHIKDSLEIMDLIQDFRKALSDIIKKQIDISSDKLNYGVKYISVMFENFSINTRMLKKGIDVPLYIDSLDTNLRRIWSQGDAELFDQIEAAITILFLEHFNQIPDFTEEFLIKYPLVQCIIKNVKDLIEEINGHMLSGKFFSKFISKLMDCCEK